LLAILTLTLLPTLLIAQERRPLEVDDLFKVKRVGSPQVSPDGAWIAHTVSTTSLEDEKSYTRIWMTPSEGGDPVPLTADKKPAASPDWSPDGRFFSFLAARDSGKTQVWVMDRRGGEAFPLTEVEQGVGSYVWSPDGSRLLLSIRDPEEKDDEEKEGDERESAPRDPWVIDRLQFKRDGTGYLTGNRHTHLFVFDVETKEFRQLTKGRWDEGQATWSPDGTKVAFVSNRTEEPDANSNSDIWIVDADLAEPTDAPRQLTTNPGSDASPAWSPDGRSIAYVTTTDIDAIWYATGHLAVIEADGGDARVLTAELDRNPSSPRYSDDGQWIWFGLEDSAASLGPWIRLGRGHVRSGREHAGHAVGDPRSRERGRWRGLSTQGDGAQRRLAEPDHPGRQP
jgi:Tol biopolymer transport system component